MVLFLLFVVWFASLKMKLEYFMCVLSFFFFLFNTRFDSLFVLDLVVWFLFFIPSNNRFWSCFRFSCFFFDKILILPAKKRILKTPKTFGPILKETKKVLSWTNFLTLQHIYIYIYVLCGAVGSISGPHF